jgi:hypothetical protein
MRRAMVAAGKAQVAAALDHVRLDADETARIGAWLLFEFGRKAGLDRRGLHSLLDDAVDAAALDEGRQP